MFDHLLLVLIKGGTILQKEEHRIVLKTGKVLDQKFYNIGIAWGYTNLGAMGLLALSPYPYLAAVIPDIGLLLWALYCILGGYYGDAVSELSD